MASQLERTGLKRGVVEYIAAGIVAIALFGIIAFGGEKILLMLNGLAGAVIIFVIAYRVPWLMIVLWAFSTQYMLELVIWDQRNIEPSLNIGGGIDMLYCDPVLFGVISALIIRLMNGERRAQTALFEEISLWSFLMIWVIFELTRSMMMFGLVSPLGEFRTYFREILMIPYVVVFFRTREDHWRLFWVLLTLTLGFIGVGMFRGGYVHGFRFAAYSKWLYQHGSLALLWGLVALYLAHRYGIWRRGNFMYGVLVLTAIGLTVISSHRSVWLTSMAVVGVLVVMDHMRISTLFKLGFAMLGMALVVDFLLDEISIVEFVQERMVALTNPTEDQTANWRYLIWLDAIDQSKDHLLEGKGLGNYFQFRAPYGAVVTAMLHNQYIQLLYQIGLVGLVLYLGFCIQVFRRLRKVYRETRDPFYQMIALMGLCVMVGVSFYHIAYDFDPFSWLFIGLAMSVAVNHRQQKEAARAYYRYYYQYQAMQAANPVALDQSNPTLR